LQGHTLLLGDLVARKSGLGQKQKSPFKFQIHTKLMDLQNIIYTIPRFANATKWKMCNLPIKHTYTTYTYYTSKVFFLFPSSFVPFNYPLVGSVWSLVVYIYIFKVFFPSFSNFDFLISISEGIENKHTQFQFAKQSAHEYARQMLVYKF